jgi:hypothetical protein
MKNKGYNITEDGELEFIGIERINGIFTFEGNLYLSNSKITKLPDNLTVSGWLDLSRTNIRELPDNLTVLGALNLSYTRIKKLPDNLTVGGALNLSHTKIKKLPDSLAVGGNLYIDNSKITELLDNLTIGGELYMEGCDIINYPLVNNCGNVNRTIYLDLQDKSLIAIGCFKGTKEEAINRINEKYSGNAAKEYITKVEQCYQIGVDMGHLPK